MSTFRVDMCCDVVAEVQHGDFFLPKRFVVARWTCAYFLLRFLFVLTSTVFHGLERLARLDVEFVLLRYLASSRPRVPLPFYNEDVTPWPCRPGGEVAQSEVFS
jgi:hypothetical protein